MSIVLNELWESPGFYSQRDIAILAQRAPPIHIVPEKEAEAAGQ